MHCGALQCLVRLPLQETGRVSCGCSPRGRTTAVASHQGLLVFPKEVAQQASGKPSSPEDGLSDWAQLPPSLSPLLAAGPPGPGPLGKQPFTASQTLIDSLLSALEWRLDSFLSQPGLLTWHRCQTLASWYRWHNPRVRREVSLLVLRWRETERFPGFSHPSFLSCFLSNGCPSYITSRTPLNRSSRWPTRWGCWARPATPWSGLVLSLHQ